MSDEGPTEPQIRAYCATYGSTIFARVLRGFPGRYQTMALDELSLPERQLVIMSYVKRRIIPHRSPIAAMDGLAASAGT